MAHLPPPDPREVVGVEYQGRTLLLVRGRHTGWYRSQPNTLQCNGEFTLTGPVRLELGDEVQVWAFGGAERFPARLVRFSQDARTMDATYEFVSSGNPLRRLTLDK